MQSSEELRSTKNIVQKLKEVEYVHAFAMLYKEDDDRKTRDRLEIFNHYTNIFGAGFLKNVIIVATHWAWNEDAKFKRKETGIGSKTEWLEFQKNISEFNELKYADQLEAIYFEPWNAVRDPLLRHNTYDNLEKLYQWALKKEPFHCLDIEVVLPKLAKLEEENANLRRENKQLDEFKTCKDERAECFKNLTKCEEDIGIGIKTSQTKTIGLGIGCTVLGIVIGVFVFRYYKLSASKVHYDDDDDDDDDEDLEQMGGNTETSRLENNQAETETETETKQ